MWSSAWYVWRATATRRVAVRLGLGAILGAGIALATVPAGGASRTSGTYDRFARSADLADVVVDGGDDSGAVLEAIAALPEVVDSARVTGLGLVALGSPSAMSLPAPGQQLLVSDERFGTDVNSFVLLDGAAARPDRLEAVVSERWSARFGTRVGDEVHRGPGLGVLRQGVTRKTHTFGSSALTCSIVSVSSADLSSR